MILRKNLLYFWQLQFYTRFKRVNILFILIFFSRLVGPSRWLRRDSACPRTRGWGKAVPSIRTMAVMPVTTAIWRVRGVSWSPWLWPWPSWIVLIFIFVFLVLFRRFSDRRDFRRLWLVLRRECWQSFVQGHGCDLHLSGREVDLIGGLENVFISVLVEFLLTDVCPYIDRQRLAPYGQRRFGTTASNQLVRLLADVINNLETQLRRQSHHGSGKRLIVWISWFWGVYFNQPSLDVQINIVPSLCFW